MTWSNNTVMKFSLTQTEPTEEEGNYWDTLEETHEVEMTWGELSSLQPGHEHYFLKRWVLGPLWRTDDQEVLEAWELSTVDEAKKES